MGQINPGLIVAGRYRLLRKLGQGGMGTVWSARNELIDREVAIKMMRPEAAANPVSLQRFFTEAKASGRLRHPNITEIFDLGQAEDGSPFLVLELLTGEPLDAVLRRVPALAPVQTLLLSRAIASGLNVAHTKGIVHRDLKPANIYLHRDPITLEIIPKVLDFGISKVTGPEAIDHHATHTGTVVGSPTYMSPEQARGVSDIDARADIWSLGILMYKCLTGRAPFNAANYNALMVAIMTEPHPPVTKFANGCPQAVEELIDDCLKKDRAHRVQSAKAFIARIDSILLGLNAERAKLEMPSEEMDDDMPTIARGNRQELLALVTATAAASPASAQMQISQPLQSQQQHAQMHQAQSPMAMAVGAASPPPMQSGGYAMPTAMRSGGFAAHPMAPPPSSMTPPPGSDTPHTSTPVAGGIMNPAFTPQQISGTQPVARVEDPAAVARRKERVRMAFGIAGGVCFFSLIIFMTVRLTRSSANADSSQSADDDTEETTSPPTTKASKKGKTKKASAPVDVETIDVDPTASAEASTPAPTMSASASTTATPTATTPTATATAAVTTATPTTTSTAPVATATATAKPTATSTGPTIIKKPPPSTGVTGPGF